MNQPTGIPSVFRGGPKRTVTHYLVGGRPGCLMRPLVTEPRDGSVEQPGTLGIGARLPGDKSDDAGEFVSAFVVLWCNARRGLSRLQ